VRLAHALLAAVALIALPLAHAQDNQTADPTVNATDMDTSAPPADDSYLNGTNGTDTGVSASDNATSADPTVSGSDLDTSVPTADTSYLDAPDASGAQPTTAATDAGASPTPAAAGHAATPGFEPAALVGGVALAALVAAARRR
jgi:hypothetical protein